MKQYVSAICCGRPVKEMFTVPVRGGSPFSSFQGIRRCRSSVLLLVCCRIHIPCLPVRPGSHGRGSRESVYRRNPVSACFRMSLVFMSRWLVGSSSISRFTGSSNSFNHGESCALSTGKHFHFLHGLFRSTEHESTQQVAYLVAYFPFATSSMVWNTVRFSSSKDAWFCAKYPICTLCPIVSVPSCSILLHDALHQRGLTFAVLANESHFVSLVLW